MWQSPSIFSNNSLPGWFLHAEIATVSLPRKDWFTNPNLPNLPKILIFLSVLCPKERGLEYDNISQQWSQRMNTTQKRVLIVDDEEDLTWTLNKKLSKDSDKFQLMTINSGKEAMNLLNQLPVDLLISDVRMPEVSGLDLLVETKKKFPRTKVIIMTAYGSSDVQREANERGCFRYLEKPFEINDLREMILEALTEKEGFKGSVADFQLSDIIQLNCLGRLTSSLQITHEDQTGYIYFADGNIVHALTDSLEGENAFYHIMSWQGGEFSVRRNAKSPKETIAKGWQSLLLEAMRRVDEISEKNGEEKEQDKRQKITEIQKALVPIVKARGTDFILVHNTAGFAITFLPESDDGNLEASDLGRHLSLFFDALSKFQENLQTTPAMLMEIQFGNLIFVSARVPDKDAWVTVLGDPGINVGFVRLELRKAVKKISPHI
jgi:CheY-like chemotaxis protein/predicted regulator of Ras-like GTPase activity (Roadblock/LC7/MglB family)